MCAHKCSFKVKQPNVCPQNYMNPQCTSKCLLKSGKTVIYNKVLIYLVSVHKVGKILHWATYYCYHYYGIDRPPGN